MTNGGVLCLLSWPGLDYRFELGEKQRRTVPSAVDPTYGSHFGMMDEQTFLGYPRSADRGTGTRNYIVVLAVSSQCTGFVRKVEAVYQGRAFGDECNGVVAVAHTEGGLDEQADESREENNRTKVLRTLAGFVVHPNVAGVLLVEQGHEQLQIQHLLEYMRRNAFPLEVVPLRTLSLNKRGFTENEALSIRLVEELLATTRGTQRVPCPVAELCLAQQCGGSDAFSGLTANPLVGWLARQIVMQGGSVVLAETDELIGAEGYILERLLDPAVGERFLGLIERFYRYAGRFGHSPEGNPSSGNLFRGLYNITLKVRCTACDGLWGCPLFVLGWRVGKNTLS